MLRATAAVRDKLVPSAELGQIVATKGWGAAWEMNMTPWDAGKGSFALKALLSRGVLPTGTALVPGCGSGYDAVSFAQAGYKAVGLDLSPIAVERARSLVEAGFKEGTLASLPEGASVTFEAADFFKYAPNESISSGGFDVVFDYTFMCALPPEMWQQWASTVKRLVAPGGELVMQIFPVSDHEGGPPFAVQPDSIRAMMAAHDFDCVELGPIPEDVSFRARAGKEWLGRFKHSLHRAPPADLK